MVDATRESLSLAYFTARGFRFAPVHALSEHLQVVPEAIGVYVVLRDRSNLPRFTATGVGVRCGRSRGTSTSGLVGCRVGLLPNLSMN